MDSANSSLFQAAEGCFAEFCSQMGFAGSRRVCLWRKPEVSVIGSMRIIHPEYSGFRIFFKLFFQPAELVDGAFVCEIIIITHAFS